MKRLCLISVIVCSAQFVCAGIDDYLIYDEAERNDLGGLDAVVELRVNQYYAFSDLRLIHTYKGEHNKVLSERGSFDNRRCEVSYYWKSLPDVNALDLLMHQTIWIVEAEVTSVLDGELIEETIYMALKGTDAFEPIEWPRYLFEDETNVVRRIFGVVKMDNEEFIRSFRDKRCYMRNNLNLITTPDEINEEYYSSLQSVLKISNKSTCFVARDVGVEISGKEIDSTESKSGLSVSVSGRSGKVPVP